MLVALAVHLLGARQEGLDALAQLHEGVARVRLLDDAGDQLAHAVLVLVVGHVPLGLADALEDHLLGGLGGDAAEVVGRHVALVDLVLVLSQALLADLGRLGLHQLARLGVDLGLAGLLLDLVEQLLLEVGRQDQLVDPEVPGVVLHVHARVAGGARRLLVGREQSVLEGLHQPVGRDALLALEHADGLDDLLRHCDPSSTRWLRLISEYGIETTPVSAATVTSSLRGAEKLAGEALVPVLGLARAHARAATEKAAEVLRLGQRALGPRRGDLQPVVHQHVAQVVGDPLAQVEIDPVRVVDGQPQPLARRPARRRAPRPRARPRRAVCSICVCTFMGIKKGGLRSPPSGAAGGRNV